MGAVRNTNSRASHTSVNMYDDYEDDRSQYSRSPRGSILQSNFSIDKNYDDEKPWQRSFSFLRRGSSKRRRRRSTVQQQGMELLGIGNNSRRPSAISLRGSPARPNNLNDHLRPNAYGYSRSRSRSRSRSPSPARRGRSPTMTSLRARSPTPIGRSPSRDIGFSDAVSDVVDLVKYDTNRRVSRPKAKLRGDEHIVHPRDSPHRGRSPVPWPNKSAWDNMSPSSKWSRGNSPDYHNSCLERRSRSPSPKPTPTHSDYHYRMGVRSRSPSPSSAHSLPLQRRPGGRKLPPTPNQPSKLRFDVHSVEGINYPAPIHSPLIAPHRGVLGIMNFPRLNPSPSHLPKLQMPPLWRDRTSTYLGTHGPPFSRTGWTASSSSLPPHLREKERYHYPMPSYHDPHLSHEFDEPLSFEEAANFGRGLRQLPSPLPNGYKPGQRGRLQRREPPLLGLRTGHGELRRSESDDDDWC